jgi:hypothetical protein
MNRHHYYLKTSKPTTKMYATAPVVGFFEARCGNNDK